MCVVRTPNDNPKKYNSPEVAASKSSLHAFEGTIRPPPGGGNGKDHDVKLSDWVRGAKDCSEHISESIKGMVLGRCVPVLVAVTAGAALHIRLRRRHPRIRFGISRP